FLTSTTNLFVANSTLNFCSNNNNKVPKPFDRFSNNTVRMTVLVPNDIRYPWSLSRVAPAIDLALRKLKQSTLLPGWKYEINFRDSRCSNIYAPMEAVRAYMEDRVHVFFGPVCDLATAPV